LLRGHAGRDISIGGTGSDLQLSDAGEDLVIGSFVQLANLQTGLADIQREWLSARPIADRISNLRGNFVGPHENGNTLLQVRITVLNDAHSDRLYGGSDRDWFFAAEDADYFGDRTVDDVVDPLT
jgi:Ca2+-binding RTX toxin-like protein